MRLAHSNWNYKHTVASSHGYWGTWDYCNAEPRGTGIHTLHPTFSFSQEGHTPTQRGWGDRMIEGHMPQSQAWLNSLGMRLGRRGQVILQTCSPELKLREDTVYEIDHHIPLWPMQYSLHARSLEVTATEDTLLRVLCTLRMGVCGIKWRGERGAVLISLLYLLCNTTEK